MDEVSLNNKFIVTVYSDVMWFDLVNHTSIRELEIEMKRHGKLTGGAARQVFRNYFTPQNPVGNLGNNVKHNFSSDFDYVSKTDLDTEITKILKNERILKQKKIPNTKRTTKIPHTKIPKNQKTQKFQKISKMKKSQINQTTISKKQARKSRMNVFSSL